jgi:hypothetical protein
MRICKSAYTVWILIRRSLSIARPVPTRDLEPNSSTVIGMSWLPVKVAYLPSHLEVMLVEEQSSQMIWHWMIWLSQQNIGNSFRSLERL